ncbi:response regulator transcription factor [Collinsella tanakaei]|uniref:response regulator transcription factor n=1 Tax=Collinsella tanakaei TaxID=626935 RepID=UPI001958A76A|nr:response regulator transcription factor [Collinsella tanakaei]MBM6778986.1 response regulator transcription factor [Collinsella tanakaei]
MDTHILVVDDEKAITDLVGIYLRNEGYQVTLAYTGADAAKAILEQDFDLAVLDIMLPDIDGFELLRTIRAEHTYPVIMLTARGSQNDKIEGLSLGADDYVVKPFRPLELVARCKAQLRRYTSYGSRATEEDTATLMVDGLVINRDARTVTVDERPVRCTPLEYSILLYLVENRGRVVSVEELFRAVWGEEFMASSSNTVMVHIRHLREKIGDDAANPRFIKNIWGVGYTIEA